MRKKIANTSEYIAADLRLLFLAKQKIHPNPARILSENDKKVSKEKREEKGKEDDISDIVIT